MWSYPPPQVETLYSHTKAKIVVVVVVVECITDGKGGIIPFFPNFFLGVLMEKMLS